MKHLRMILTYFQTQFIILPGLKRVQGFAKTAATLGHTGGWKVDQVIITDAVSVARGTRLEAG